MAFKTQSSLFFIFIIALQVSADVGSNIGLLPTVEKKTLSLTASLEIPSHTFLISTKAGRVDQRQVDQRIQYTPTFGPNIGIYGQYEQWNFGLKKRFYLGSLKDEQKYGKTDYDDYRLGYHFNKFIAINAYLQNYHGFYTDLNGQEGFKTTFGDSNTSSATSSPSEESHIIKRSDVVTRNYGLQAQFALPLLPFFALFNTKEPVPPTDSWEFNLLSKIYYNHLEIIGDQVLVPTVTLNSFSPISSLKEMSSNTLGIGLGLGVVVHATAESSFGLAALAGPGFSRQANIYLDHDETNYTTASEINANIYYRWKNAEHGFQSGLYFDTISSKVKDVHFDSSHLGVNLAYSYSGFQF